MTPPHRPQARYLALLGGALVAGAAGVGLLRLAGAREPAGWWLWLPLLGAMFAAASALQRLELSLPGTAVVAPGAQPALARRRGIGAAAIGAALLLTVYGVLRLWPDVRIWRPALVPWLAGLALVLVGAALLGAVGAAAPRAATAIAWPRAEPRPWLVALLFGAILLLAIGLRVYRLDSIPAGIYVDETNGGLDALYILEGRDASPFGTGWYETPNGYLYYMAGIFKLFGANWYSLKLASLLPAILTIPAVFLLGRLLFGTWAGLSAMLLLAVSRWHLSMSRWGWNETAPPLFQVLATFFVIRGLRDRRASDYALGGLLSGLAIYTYLSSRLAAATLALYLGYWLISDPEGPRTALRRSGQGLALFAVAALVAVAPIAVTYAADPFRFTNRASEISVLRDIRSAGSLEPLVANVGDILRFFHQTGDHQGKHNLPYEPMADPVTGLLFAIGLAAALLGWRDHRRVLLLVWLVLGLAGSFLSSHAESPQSYRSLTALPAVVLLAADALDRLGRVCYGALRGTRGVGRGALPGMAAGGLMVVALAGASLWESAVYFGPQARSLDVIRGFNPTENTTARETIAALQAGTAVYLSPTFSDFAPLRFLVYGVIKAQSGKNTLDDRPYTVVVPEVSLPLPDTGHDALLLLDATYWPLREYLASFYPQAQMALVTLADGSPVLMRVTVPRAQIAALQGLTERVGTAGAASERQVPTVAPVAGVAPGATVAWTGALRIEHGGTYTLRSPSGGQVLVDGQPVDGPQYLGRGLYGLQVRVSGAEAAAAQLVWQVGDAAPTPVPPTALFRVPSAQQGLLGAYYRNRNWAGEPVFRQVTPFLLLAWPDEQPLVPSGEFSARYTGALRITEPGRYHLRIEADDGARLVLDGTVVGEGLTAGQPNKVEATLDLAAGDHPLEVDYFQQGGGTALKFFWRRDDGSETPVPPAALVPPQR